MSDASRIQPSPKGVSLPKTERASGGAIPVSMPLGGAETVSDLASLPPEAQETAKDVGGLHIPPPPGYDAPLPPSLPQTPAPRLPLIAEDLEGKSSDDLKDLYLQLRTEYKTSRAAAESLGMKENISIIEKNMKMVDDFLLKKSADEKSSSSIPVRPGSLQEKGADSSVPESTSPAPSSTVAPLKAQDLKGMTPRYLNTLLSKYSLELQTLLLSTKEHDKVSVLEQNIQTIQDHLASVEGRGKVASVVAQEAKPQSPQERLADLKGKTSQLQEGKKLVLKDGRLSVRERNVGITGMLSRLFLQGTGSSVGSKNAAMQCLTELENMLKELEGKTDPESQKTRTELLDVAKNLLSSTWFVSVSQHHSYVSQKMTSLVKTLGDSLADKTAIVGLVSAKHTLSLPGVVDYVKNIGKQMGDQKIQEHLENFRSSVKSLQSELASLDEKGPDELHVFYAKVMTLKGLGVPKELQGDFDAVENACQEKLLQLALDCCKPSEDAGPEVLEQKHQEFRTCLKNLSSANRNKLQSVIKRMAESDEKVQEYLKKFQADMMKDLFSELEQVKDKSSADFHAFYGTVSVVKGLGIPEELKEQFEILENACQKRLFELASDCCKPSAYLSSQALAQKHQEFRACLKSLSLVNRNKLQDTVKKMEAGSEKQQFLKEIADEKQSWLFSIAVGAKTGEASLSDMDKAALEDERRQISQYEEEVQKAKATRIQAESGSSGEAPSLKLPDRPYTPISDALLQAADFQSGDLAHIAQYYGSAKEFFGELEKFSQRIGEDSEQRASFADFALRLGSQMTGASGLEAISGSVENIAKEIAKDSIPKAEQFREAFIPSPAYTVKVAASQTSSVELFKGALLEDRTSQAYKQAVSTVAQDLFCHTAEAFLNDSVTDIRLTYASSYNEKLSKAGLEVRNYAVSDILSSTNLVEVQNKGQFWLDIAEKCFESGDYTSGSMILAALTDASISSLMPEGGTPYAQQLLLMKGKIAADKNYYRVRQDQEDRLKDGKVVVPFLAPFDVDMEHVKENTLHDRGEIIAGMANLMHRLHGSLWKSVNAGGYQRTTDLTEKLHQSRPMFGKDLIACTFKPSKRIRSKIEKEEQELSLGKASKLSEESLAAIDLEDSSLELTAEGKLGKKIANGPIDTLRKTYAEKVTKKALGHVEDLKNPEKREKALHEIGKMSALFSPKTQEQLAKAIQNLPEEVQKEALAALRSVTYLKDVVIPRLASFEKAKEALEIFKQKIASLPESSRNLLKEEIRKASLDASIAEDLQKFLKSL